MIRTMITITVLCLCVAEETVMAEDKVIRFGQITAGKNGGDVVQETTVMTLKENLSYGWIAQAKEGVRSVRVKEIIRIPKAGDNFKGEKVTAAAQVVEKEKELSVVAGQFGSKWRPSATDPSGDYFISVTVDGVLLLETKFILLPP
jgi:hypothetical protein